MKKHKYSIMLLCLMAIMVLLFIVLKGQTFLQMGTLKSIAVQFPIYGVITLGVMFCFLLGKMDMSFVALGNFATVLAVMYMNANYSETNAGGVILVGILISVAVAIVGGIINGLLVSMLDIPPVMATIAMQLVWKGISIGLTNGNSVTLSVPEYTAALGSNATVLGFLPVPLLIFIVVFAVSVFLLKCTVYGEKVYMVGSNIKAAKFSGINTTGMIIGTYVLCDVISVIGCLLMVASLNSAKADNGESYVMRCILILVLGGILPDGGIGKPLNALLAIITIQIIATGVNMLDGLNTYHASFIWGGLLILVLIFSTKINSDSFLSFKKSANKKKVSA